MEVARHIKYLLLKTQNTLSVFSKEFSKRLRDIKTFIIFHNKLYPHHHLANTQYQTRRQPNLIKQGRTDPKCLLGARICGETRESRIYSSDWGGLDPHFDIVKPMFSMKFSW